MKSWTHSGLISITRLEEYLFVVELDSVASHNKLYDKAP
jgi:hypothetical protein